MRRFLAWCACAVLLVVLGEFRVAVAPLAWLGVVASIRAARLAPSDRAALLLLPVFVVGLTLATLKILTPPMHPAMALLFGVPMGLARAVALLLDRSFAARESPWLRVLVFPTAMAGLDRLQHTVTTFGTWGSLANAFVHEPALLQTASVLGADGLSFLGYLAAAGVATCLERPAAPSVRAVARWAWLPLALAYGLGALRLGLALEHDGPVVRVAAVDTDATFAGLPLPTDAERARVDAGLERRIRRAAAAGARLVVTTEASTLVPPAEETALHARFGDLARALRIHLALGYVIPRRVAPLRYANRYVLLRPDGRVAHVYDKRQPVPGEPADPGGLPSPVEDTPFGRIAGAICYDYDVPRFALDHARRAVDVVVLPASDWRGIDPVHAEMATLRAVESGHSIVRATRFGRHVIVDGFGVVRAQQSHFERGEGVLVAEVPTRRVRTVHAAIGPALPSVHLASWLLLLVSAWRARRARPPGTTPPASAG